MIALPFRTHSASRTGFLCGMPDGEIEKPGYSDASHFPRISLARSVSEVRRPLEDLSAFGETQEYSFTAPPVVETRR